MVKREFSNKLLFPTRFQLLEGESIEFKALGLRDNVAQLSVFEVAIQKHPLSAVIFKVKRKQFLALSLV